MRIELHTCQIVAHTHTHTRTHAHTRSNTNVRPVRSGPTRHRHSINKRRSMRSRHRHCDVFGQRMMVRLRPHTASNTHDATQFKQHKRTRCSSRGNTTPFNKRRSSQSHHRHCNVFQQRVRVKLRPHTASNINKATPPNSSNVNSRAVCLEPPNTIFSPHIQQTEINARASE